MEHKSLSLGARAISPLLSPAPSPLSPHAAQPLMDNGDIRKAGSPEWALDFVNGIVSSDGSADWPRIFELLKVRSVEEGEEEEEEGERTAFQGLTPSLSPLVSDATRSSPTRCTSNPSSTSAQPRSPPASAVRPEGELLLVKPTALTSDSMHAFPVSDPRRLLARQARWDLFAAS